MQLWKQYLYKSDYSLAENAMLCKQTMFCFALVLPCDVIGQRLISGNVGNRDTRRQQNLSQGELHNPT